MFNPFKLIVEHAIDAARARSPLWRFRLDSGYGIGWQIARRTGMVSFQSDRAPVREPYLSTDSSIPRHAIRVEYGPYSVEIEATDFWFAARAQRGVWSDVAAICSHIGGQPHDFAFWAKPLIQKIIGPLRIGISLAADEERGFKEWRAKRDAEKQTEASAPPS